MFALVISLLTQLSLAHSLVCQNGDTRIIGQVNMAQHQIDLTFRYPQATDRVRTAVKAIGRKDFAFPIPRPGVNYPNSLHIEGEEFKSAEGYRAWLDIFVADRSFHRVAFVTSFEVPDFDRGAYQVDVMNCEEVE
ncbi:MAG: hypothetical protein HYR96_01395 [Deltaproteobacteria bacterium]|nr:hypothetical protein [Deltaproteobacteria bacterium]MBI3294372.1 hypothetical protein [Deltaproteobacteria bacterium]